MDWTLDRWSNTVEEERPLSPEIGSPWRRARQWNWCMWTHLTIRCLCFAFDCLVIGLSVGRRSFILLWRKHLQRHSQ